MVTPYQWKLDKLYTVLACVCVFCCLMVNTLSCVGGIISNIQVQKPCEMHAPAIFICARLGLSDFSLNFVVLNTIVHLYLLFFSSLLN